MALSFASADGDTVSSPSVVAVPVDGLYTLGAFAVIRSEDGRVLLSHRRDLDLWNLPGGKINVDELPDAAVIREVREETGLDVEVVRLTGVYGRSDGRADVVFTFECRAVGGSLEPTTEADRHEWFHGADLPLNTIPKHVARIRDALSGEPEPLFRTLTEPSGREWLKSGMTSGIDLCFPELTTTVEQWWRGIHPLGVPPHVTILTPWRNIVTDADLDQLGQVVGRHSAFQITFASVGRFEGGFVYLDPGDNHALDALITGIRKAFPDTPPYGGTIADPVAHLTIGKAPPGDKLDALYASAEKGLARHLPITANVKEVTVLVARPDNSWMTRAKVPLARR